MKGYIIIYVQKVENIVAHGDIVCCQKSSAAMASESVYMRARVYHRGLAIFKKAKMLLCYPFLLYDNSAAEDFEHIL